MEYLRKESNTLPTVHRVQRIIKDTFPAFRELILLSHRKRTIWG